MLIEIPVSHLSINCGITLQKARVGVPTHRSHLPQSCRSSLAELMARTSLDLELDLQASRTRQRQLNEEICALRELRQRLEDAQLRGQTDLPHWVLRDERFRSLLKEAERQVRGLGAAAELGSEVSFP
jgi:hypothetical protein